MVEKTKFLLITWWRSLTITVKLGVIVSLLLVIGVFQSLVSIRGFQVITQSVQSAEDSLEVQRLTLEMSRDWESMKYYQTRFFAEYEEIGFIKAKERFALPAGEKLSDIIRTGADLRRMTSAEDASDNLKQNDETMRVFLYHLSQYVESLDHAVQLTFDPTNQNIERIKKDQANLENLSSLIEPSFTSFVLMAQNEVLDAKNEVQRTRTEITCYLIGANIVGVLLAGLILFLFRRTITTGVKRLTQASKKMQNGVLDVRVNINSKDEFGSIAAAFNSMAASIQERTNALQEYEYRYQALFKQNNDAVFLIGLDGIIFKTNQKAREMHGYLEDEMNHLAFQQLLIEADREAFHQILTLAQSDIELPVQGYLVYRKEKTIFPVEINLTRVLDKNNHPQYLQIISRDISEQKELEEHLRYMALHDGLTGLPNRTHLYTHLYQVLEEAKEKQYLIAVLYLDIDGFKAVNDTFGHEQGDKLLIEIGKILKNTIRSTDLAARVGGDEFIIFLNNILNPDSAQQIAEKIINKLAEPIIIDEQPVVLTTSLGISLFPQHGDEIELLIKHADQAMYQVKNNTKNGFQFYT